MRLIPLLFVLVTGLCLSLSPAHAIRLEYRLKAGDQWKQSMRMKGDGTLEGGMKVDMQMEIVTNVSNKIGEVKTDGSFVSTIDAKMDTVKVVANGTALPRQPEPPTKPIKVTISKLGKPLKLEGSQGSVPFGNFDLHRIIGISPNLFPDKDISVGDVWDASPDPNVFPVKVEGKLLSVKNASGKQVAEVESRISISAEGYGKLVHQITGVEVEFSGPGLSGTLTNEIDLATGIPIAGKGTFDLDFTFVMNNVQIRMAMKMDLVTDVTR